MKHLNLKAGAPARLFYLRERAKKVTLATKERFPLVENPITRWQNIRFTGFHNQAANYITLTQSKDGSYWYCHTGPYFSREEYVDEYEGSPVDHKGWFVDSHQLETLRGLIVSLPRGHFLAGYESSDNGERVYFNEIFADPYDAISYAEGKAEEAAANQTEYYDAYSQCNALEDSIVLDKERVKELLILRNNSCFNYARAELKATISRIREARMRIHEITLAYGL